MSMESLSGNVQIVETETRAECLLQGVPADILAHSFGIKAERRR